MTTAGIYELGLGRNAANHVPLSPVSLVKRAAEVYPHYPAIEYQGQTRSWAQVFERSLALAGAVRARANGVQRTVAALLPNTPAAVELAYAIPMSGAVLNMINTRLDAAGIAFILDHGEADLFFIDSGLAALAAEALSLASVTPHLVFIDDKAAPGIAPEGAEAYEDFIRRAIPLDREDVLPGDEWDAMALNYTSGTTGNPKGVVYHHRGAYLNAMGNLVEWDLAHHPRYLWTLPLFHCNGWCFPWTIAAVAGTHICLRAPVAEDILSAIADQEVTHLSGAPIVLNMIATLAEARGIRFERTIRMTVAGAAPPAAVLARAEAIGISITHVYGLTEVYGPSAVCAWKGEWDELSPDVRSSKRARQGVPYVTQEEVSVRDPETLEMVPADGSTLGEVMFRGNAVMRGYLKNPTATEAAFKGGFFRTGDLGVRHKDGYVELKDRSKDIIISGGENISSIEVESVLYKHPAVADAAVVAAPDEKWGETPAAFIELKPDVEASDAELITFCREHLAHFKCPRLVYFGSLPKTSTGKIQKFQLRERLTS